MLNKSLTILPILLILTIFSCKTKEEPETPKPLAPQELTPGPIVHDTLTTDQLKKIETIQQTFAEVNPSTLEETIDDFKRDQHPDREIESWLAMAHAYGKFTTKHKGLDLNKKTEAYRLILMRSMEDETNARAEIGLKYLTDKEVKEIFSYYTLEARPITAVKK